MSTWPPEPPPRRAIGQTPPAAPQPAPTGEIAAAVLVPVYVDGDGGAGVVFTRRRADLRRHAGEISFPGGRRDAADRTLTETALREAEEEIGLERESVSVLGELSPTATFVTNYLIHPFVGLIPAGLAWRVSPAEVDVVLELTAEELRAGRTRTRLERRGFSFETDAYLVGENLIWGATARILDELLARLQTAGPDGRPFLL